MGLESRDSTKNTAPAHGRDGAVSAEGPMQLMLHDFFNNNQPVVNAMAGILAYFGVTNKFSRGNSSVKSALDNAGEPGSQLVSRWADLENRGWYVGPLKVNDPLLVDTTSNPISRAFKFLQTGGYNADQLNGKSVKALTYNDWTANLGGIAGLNNNPQAESAMKVAHELGHHNLTALDYPDLSTLSAAEREVAAKRLLFEETTAIWSQLWVAQKNGLNSSSADALRSAFANDKGGSLIKSVWTNSSPEYKSLDAISNKDANQFVSELTKNLSADGSGMFKNGALQPIDLTRATGMGQKLGAISGDAEIMARMESSPSAYAYTAPAVEAASGLSRTMRGLGALGLALSATDVLSSFNQSAGTGVGKLGRIGFNCASFESGLYLGNGAGRVIATAIGERVPFAYAAIPAIALARGLGLSIYTDAKAGDSIQGGIKKWIDKK